MKKYLILASAALVALAACNKEVEIQEPVVSNDSAVLTFTSERPNLSSGTKTIWDNDSKSIFWSEGDKIKVGFTFNDDWWAQSLAYASTNESPNNNIKFYQSQEVQIDSESSNVGTFTVPTESGKFVGPTTNGDFVFYAIYPYSLIENNLNTAPTANVVLKTNQSPVANSFDATTDIMVGTSNTINSTGLPSDPIELDWKRVVAHVALTFTNMGFQGTETPTKITLTFNEEAKVAGSFSLNIADGTIGAGSANEVVLEGNGLTVEGTSINAWATVLPVSFSSLNVEIKTDKATYARSITGLDKTFKGNARNTLKINMATASRTASAQYEWVKTDLSAITASDVFVIVGNNGDNYAMSNDKGTSAPEAVAVTVANDKLTVAPADKLQWTLTKDGNNYTFYPNGTTTTWLYCINNNNGLKVGDTADNNAFIIEDNYLYNNGQSRYIGIYNSQDWRSYTSINNNIKNQTFAFYVKTAAGPAVTWNLESITITTEPNTTVYTAGETFDPAGMVVTGHFVDADNASNTKDEAVTGYTITPDGALAVTDTQVTITYQGKTATQNITVNAPSYDFETVAELNTLVTSSGDNTKNNTAVQYSGKLTSAVVSFTPDANNAIIKDATGSILVFKNSHGLLQGQTFSGEVTVSAKLYYTTVEITAIDASFSGSQTEVLPETVSLSQLEDNFSTYQNAYVKVEGLTVTAKDGKNISVSDGSKTYLVYDNASASTAGVGDVITAVGTVADHNGTNQIKVWASSDITVTSSAPKAITFSQPTGAAATAGCSFKVKVDGAEITSGATVASGKTVSLEATVGTDYTFGGWTVTGAEVANASALTTTFEMGSSAVTVEASFTSNNEPTLYTTTVTASKVTSDTASWTGTANETWDVSVDGGATNQNINSGYAQVGTRNSPSTSITISTSTVLGTIKSIVIDCASYSGLGTVSATVGGSAFGTQSQSIPSWSSNAGGTITFSGSASGAISIVMTNGNNGRAMYIKSITVTYEN